MYEEAHVQSLAHLIDIFGESMRGKIVKLYNEARKDLEMESKVRDFVPILAERRVLEAMGYRR